MINQIKYILLVAVCVALLMGAASGWIDGSAYVTYYGMAGTAPYVRLVNVDQMRTYDATAAELSATPTWTDTDIGLVDDTAYSGAWYFKMPATVPNGTYDLLVYDASVAAGSRSNADTLSSKSRRIVISNGTVKYWGNP